MILPPPDAARFNSFKAPATAALSRDARHALSRSICPRSASSDTVRMASAAPANGDGSLSRYLLTPTTICSPRSIASSRAVFSFDQLLFQVARIDCGNGATHLLDALEFFLGQALQIVDLARNLARAVKNIPVVEQVGLVSENLLHAQRPLLVPWPRQAKRFIPCRQLDRACTRIFGQRDGQHLNQNARHVIFGLRLGQSERVHLNAIAEQPSVSRR